MRVSLKVIIVALVIVSIMPMPALAEISWCTPGESYVGTGVDGAGNVTSSIKGTTTFKGNEYCETEAIVEAQGLSVTYTYYISEDQEDMWIVYEIMGQTQEMHISEGGFTMGTAAPRATTTTTTSTPAVTGTEAPVMATTTPTATTVAPPTPGFEAVFTIAGILAVAYLISRRR